MMATEALAAYGGMMLFFLLWGVFSFRVIKGGIVVSGGGGFIAAIVSMIALIWAYQFGTSLYGASPQGEPAPSHHYAIHEDGQYGYAKADGEILMVYYMGHENHEDTFAQIQPSGYGHIFRCANPCKVYIDEEVIGRQVMSSRRIVNAQGTIAWEMFDDAAYGRMDEYKPK
jgi:hypothetical protein